MNERQQSFWLSEAATRVHTIPLTTATNNPFTRVLQAATFPRSRTGSNDTGTAHDRRNSFANVARAAAACYSMRATHTAGTLPQIHTPTSVQLQAASVRQDSDTGNSPKYGLHTCCISILASPRTARHGTPETTRRGEPATISYAFPDYCKQQPLQQDSRHRTQPPTSHTQ